MQHARRLTLLLSAITLAACSDLQNPAEPDALAEAAQAQSATSASTPAAQIQHLRSLIESLQASKVLNKGQANSLFAKLDAIAAKYSRGSAQSASSSFMTASFSRAGTTAAEPGKVADNLIDALVSQLQAFEKAGVLSPAQTQSLIVAATGIPSGGFALTSITAGANHTCGLAALGYAYCWGNNVSGQLGNGTTVSSTKPVAVTGAPAFVALSAGGNSTCGLTAEGSAFCWGGNFYGQLGDGTTTSSQVPVQVPANGITFSAITVGSMHTCALTPGGEAYCWGRNGSGALGNGIGDVVTVPTKVSGTATFRSIGAAILTTCAVGTDGKTYCWGSRAFNALGDGTGTAGSCVIGGVTRSSCTTTPVAVAGPVDFSSVSAGGVNGCALAAGNGAAYCWGSNWAGQLGTGSTSRSPIPVGVFGSPSYALLSSNGENTVIGHTCAITPAGDVECWGNNAEGQLGRASTETCTPFGTLSFACSTRPGGVATVTNAVGLDTGIEHTCAATSSGAAFCWGRNQAGALGDGTTTSRSEPVRVANPEFVAS